MNQWYEYRNESECYSMFAPVNHPLNDDEEDDDEQQQEEEEDC